MPIPSAPQAHLPSQQLLPLTRRKLRTHLPLPDDAMLSSGLRYGILAIYACTTYSIIVTGGGLIYYGTINPPWWFALPALLTVAATLRPMHNWLRLSIDRLIYDWHADPYAVISELQQHLDLEPDQTPQTIMQAIVATIAATLRLPYVAIETRSWFRPTKHNLRHTDCPDRTRDDPACLPFCPDRGFAHSSAPTQ